MGWILGFILRPVVVPVRYAALRIMKKLWRPEDDRPLKAAARHMLEEIILPSVFDFFRNATFRELAGFASLSQTEHDRIFNELQAAGITLALFGLDHADALAKPESYHFWRGARDSLAPSFEEKLLELGVDSANINLMGGLIQMRYNEYAALSTDVREFWSTEELEFQKLESDLLRRSLIWVYATALGTSNHIRRGRLRKKDRLPSLLRFWLLYLNEDVGKFIRRL